MPATMPAWNPGGRGPGGGGGAEGGGGCVAFGLTTPVAVAFL
eukprot:CAMPEP_0172717594 /NCGR_PEP_ID=MMETSP1074-20121228/71887_1 /TAXON_ID=2916 /ORGANISM="Ceratium fusus, Strain PA161109" /LENGTH=41 /DNA_ID= /DNA_START= /DNA_END= /DNA_ORIENTATION=